MSKIKYLKQEKLSKGLNLYSRATMLTNEESTEATNVMAIGQYSIGKREGIVKLLKIGSSKIDGIGTFYKTDGTRKLMAMSGGKLYTVETGSAEQVTGAGSAFSSGRRTDFCQAGANVFISNGTDTMRQYDGSTATVTVNGVILKNLIYHKNCLYGIGNSSYGSRLYRSGTDAKLGDFTYHDPNNLFATSIYISNNDGQDCISLFKYEDKLFVAKNKSLYRVMVGSDDVGTLAIEQVDSGRGADTHWATDSVENNVFFYNQTGLHSFGYEPNYLDQLRTKIISLRIEKRLKLLDKSALENVCGLYSNGKYYLSFRSSGTAHNNVVMVYDKYRTGFWEYTLNANCFCEYKDDDGNERVYFGSSTDGSIYYFDDTAKNDDGVAFQTRWKSPKYSIADYTQSKFILKVLLYIGKKIGDFTVSAYVDDELVISKNVLVSNYLGSGIGVDQIGVGIIGVGSPVDTVYEQTGSDVVQLPINKMGRNIQLVIEDNNTNKSWELNNIDIALVKLNKYYQPKVL